LNSICYIRPVVSRTTGHKVSHWRCQKPEKKTFQDVEAWIPFQSNILITTESDPAHEQFMQFEAEISELNANIIRGASAVRYRWWLF